MNKKLEIKMKNMWTDLRMEIEKCKHNFNLEIVPLNIIKWEEIEHKIINYFTGKNESFTWMWENNILEKFKCYAKEITDFNILSKILLETINQSEMVWFFMEDTLNYESKYWGYEGKINRIIKLLSEIWLTDFYIVSKKLEWVIGQNHHDVLFGFGGIKNILENKIIKNNGIHPHII